MISQEANDLKVASISSTMKRSQAISIFHRYVRSLVNQQTADIKVTIACINHKAYPSTLFRVRLCVDSSDIADDREVAQSIRRKPKSTTTTDCDMKHYQFLIIRLRNL
jgi:hypothetical protein